MSRCCVGLMASVCLFVFSSSSTQAQDGRGSRGGSPRSGIYIYGNSYSNGYRYLYPSGYVIPIQTSAVTPIQTVAAPPVQPAVIGVTIAPSNGQSSGQSVGVTPSTSSVSSSAKVTVMVPDGAQVWFDGTQTDKREGARVFTSAPIEAGQAMRVSVKISWAGNTREMQLSMQSGDIMTIDFRGPP
jgi:uncharacterized protein (TIGR03000 family)